MKTFCLCFILLMLFACQSAPQMIDNRPHKKTAGINKMLNKQKKFLPTASNKETGYQELENGNIVFVFSPELYGLSDKIKVFLEGSFNGWLKGIDSKWMLTPNKNNTLQFLELPYSDIAAPGNCGFPEFRFYIIHEKNLKVEELSPKTNFAGFKIGSNSVLLRTCDNPDEVVLAQKAMQTKKQLSDFNIRNPQHVAVLSNVRQVPATKLLWRGYHPYKISRSNLDTERTRLELVKKLLKANNIKSIICLSGEESPNKRENICEYQQEIINAGHQLYVDSSYNEVYYHSDSEDFSEMIAKIIHFINKSPAPFYVHCRLGSDRTGVVCAVLAALCGADWNEIVEDYQKTNEMGIGEYRSHRLLQYSFEKILNRDINDVENLQREISAHFATSDYLTNEEIELAVKKLCGKD
ncbi:MAG: tyrosine-protein phosphatase [Spirochaetales bacterium]|nr:tyrosine-protein phosphatase [Spirochaetales bacterium]